MPTVFEKGPYLTNAVFCEKAIQEKDGVLTLVRLVDKVTASVTGPAQDVPGRMPPVPVNITLVVSLKNGSARGRYALLIRPENPSGEQQSAQELPVNLSGDVDGGHNFLIAFNMVADQEGVYWIDILLRQEPTPESPPHLLTRIPLRIEYVPHRMSPSDADQT